MQSYKASRFLPKCGGNWNEAAMASSTSCLLWACARFVYRKCWPDTSAACIRSSTRYALIDCTILDRMVCNCMVAVNGQKVWSSGAQFSKWGELIARSDVDVAKHKGMTAFIIPMDLPGIEIRPIKQMSGGSSFNEVFFNDVRVPDSMRLGNVGDGWNVALTTLGFERDHSGSDGGSARPGGTWSKLVATAKALGRDTEPAVREALVRAYMNMRIEGFVNRRAADMRAAGAPPGPEGSLGKLVWTEGMTAMSTAVTTVLGPRLIADTGEWGTYAWGEHVLGAPGYRIAGGSDEVQRNIIGERVLGLPAEPRVDKNTSWKDTPR